MEQYLQYVFPVFSIILGLGLTWIVGLVIKKMKFNENEIIAINAYKSAIMQTYREVVKPWKDNQGGKLSDSQKLEARERAKRLALDFVTGASKRFMIKMWGSRKDQIIESIVSKFKKDGAK